MKHMPMVLGTLFLSTALLSPGTAASAAPPVQSLQTHQPMLEMVFVLDTTGSMGGLIDAAKQRVWQIVNDVMQSPNHPQVRLGLVAYRDHGDEYITKVLPLTANLDQVYTTLMDCKAEGGGDTPEDVRQALDDAVRKSGWSVRSPQIAQVLFLVGDAPPHEDYADEPDTAMTTKVAVESGFVVNTVECGAAEDTKIAWQKIASEGNGEFFAIPQDGGVQAINTPYDKELSALGSKIGATYSAYGFGSGRGGALARYKATRVQSMIESHVAAAAPLAAQADRAVNKAINSEAYDNDLTGGIVNGTVKIDHLQKDQLSADLQALPPVAQKKEILRRVQVRKKLQAQILTLSKKRDAYLTQQRLKQSHTLRPTSFDLSVVTALKREVSKKGIRF